MRLSSVHEQILCVFENGYLSTDIASLYLDLDQWKCYILINISYLDLTFVPLRCDVVLIEIIRIYHEFVDRIDKYVPSVTVFASRGLPSDAKQ